MAEPFVIGFSWKITQLDTNRYCLSIRNGRFKVEGDRNYAYLDVHLPEDFLPSLRERQPEVTGIAMLRAGLPSKFVFDVVDIAHESGGIRDLLALWTEASDQERKDIEEDLRAALADRQRAASVPKDP